MPDRIDCKMKGGQKRLGYDVIKISPREIAKQREKITSFSLLFLIPRTRSVRFLSNIRSKLPFTLRSAMTAFKKKLNALLARYHFEGTLLSRIGETRLDSIGRSPD